MKTLFTIFLSCSMAGVAWAQGCSSAGFCTMGALKADQKFSAQKRLKLNYIEVNQLIATSGFGETINATTLDVALTLGTKNSFQIRLPYVWVNGPLANTEGFGDVYLTYTRSLIKEKDYQLNASLGTKIPRFTTNLTTPEGLPLPMYYSPSLGTYDLIAGVSFINKKWLLGIGYQQVVSGNPIDNQFNPQAWEGTPLAEQAARYDASMNLERGADIMLRIERNIRRGRYNFFVGAMPVYRITADRMTDAEGREIAIDSPTGLAITGIVGGGYRFNAHSSLKLFYGRRLSKKPYNGDGLMKEDVGTIAYEFRF